MTRLESWQTFVQTGRNEFVDRYHREYLNSEKFRGFDEALVRLMELLELPGVGRILSGALWVLRTPYRLLRGLAVKLLSRPEGLSRPEQPVLEDAFNGWIDLLRKEAARRADSHPLWAHVSQGFHSGGLAEQARERFQQSMRAFQSTEAEEVERTARDIYEQLEKNPVVLYSLRGGKFALDVAAVAGSIVGRRHRLSGLHHRAARRLADASARRIARLAGGGRPARANAPPATRVAKATFVGADGGMADEMAGDRRLVVRAAATGPEPHSAGGTATRCARSSSEELGERP